MAICSHCGYGSGNVCREAMLADALQSRPPGIAGTDESRRKV
ncbi:MAG: hypothetical protein ACE14P_01770 [Methanotrichaceae archaeon]